MEDDDLLDLEAFTQLLGTEDDLQYDAEPSTPDIKKDGQNLEQELIAMKERIKLLETELQKKNQTQNVVSEIPKLSSGCTNTSSTALTKTDNRVASNIEISKKVSPPSESKTKLELVREDIFSLADKDEPQPKDIVTRDSLVHDGDTDSSDDEMKRNNKPSSLNDFGKTIKKKLVEKPQYSDIQREPPKKTWKSSFQATASSDVSKQRSKSDNIETDPFSGLRIINPLVSSSALRERMTGRKMIKVSVIKNHVRYGDVDGDWVTIGVVIHKSEPKTSKNGKTYSIWKLSDLQDMETTVSLFLFGEVHKGLWKTSAGSVIGLLNSKIMPNREGDKVGGVCLTVDHPGKIMLIGQSKDFGTCKGKRRDGAPCHNLVNLKDCEFCVYHVQKEYKKAGRRMELQSSFSGVEPKGLKTQSMKSKILNKNGIMYGGQLYTVPLGKPDRDGKKQKDKLTLNSLSLKRKAQEVEQSTRNTLAMKHMTEKENEAVNDIYSSSEFLGSMLTLPTAGSRNLIKHLVTEDAEVKVRQGIIKSVTPKELLEMHKKSMEGLKRKRSQLDASPSPTRQLKMPRFMNNKPSDFDLELTDSSTSGTLDIAKMRALAKLSGKPVQKSNPNSVKGKPISPEQTQRILKKVESNITTPPSSAGVTSSKTTGSAGSSSKKGKLQSRLGEISQEDIDRIMKMKSSHSCEVDEEEERRLNHYFNNLEKKEQMENKMQTVTEITCTVVSCKICKYTSQHPSELCARENHVLRRHKALKRFFKCVQCKHRTFAFSKLPTKACRNCGSNSFEKTAMMKPKQGPKLASEELLIRGEEMKFIK